MKHSQFKKNSHITLLSMVYTLKVILVISLLMRGDFLLKMISRMKIKGEECLKETSESMISRIFLIFTKILIIQAWIMITVCLFLRSFRANRHKDLHMTNKWRVEKCAGYAMDTKKSSLLFDWIRESIENLYISTWILKIISHSEWNKIQ